MFKNKFFLTSSIFITPVITVVSCSNQQEVFNIDLEKYFNNLEYDILKDEKFPKTSFIAPLIMKDPISFTSVHDFNYTNFPIEYLYDFLNSINKIVLSSLVKKEGQKYFWVGSWDRRTSKKDLVETKPDFEKYFPINFEFDVIYDQLKDFDIDMNTFFPNNQNQSVADLADSHFFIDDYPKIALNILQKSKSETKIFVFDIMTSELKLQSRDNSIFSDFEWDRWKWID